MTQKVASVGRSFHLFVLGRESYYQYLATSISDVDSRVDGRWIYVSMMCGDVEEVVLVDGRHI